MHALVTCASGQFVDNLCAKRPILSDFGSNDENLLVVQQTKYAILASRATNAPSGHTDSSANVSEPRKHYDP